MSGMPSDEATGQVRLEGDVSDKKEEKTQEQSEASGMPSPQEEEAAIKKKYGGILPKRTPHITKVNAFFILVYLFFSVKMMIIV